MDLSALAFNPAATPNAMPNPFAAMMGGAGFPGAGGADGGDFMAQMMASMSAGGPPGAGGLPSTPVSPFPPVQKTMLDRVFPLIHFVSMVLLALYAVLVAEPAKRVSMLGMGEGVQWHVWGSLIHSAPATGVKGLMGFGGLSQVPLFYLFITVELLLQTTRALLLRVSRPFDRYWTDTRHAGSTAPTLAPFHSPPLPLPVLPRPRTGAQDGLFLHRAARDMSQRPRRAGFRRGDGRGAQQLVNGRRGRAGQGAGSSGRKLEGGRRAVIHPSRASGYTREEICKSWRNVKPLD